MDICHAAPACASPGHNVGCTVNKSLQVIDLRPYRNKAKETIWEQYGIIFLISGCLLGTSILFCCFFFCCCSKHSPRKPPVTRKVEKPRPRTYPECIKIARVITTLTTWRQAGTDQRTREMGPATGSLIGLMYIAVSQTFSHPRLLPVTN